MKVTDLGLMPYRQAWEIQERAHDSVVDGAEEQLLIVQHPPVITFGRRGDDAGNLLRSPEELEQLGVELVHSDRGGDITYHGPGQIVAYPIIRLIDHHLSVGGYVHQLESIVISAIAQISIEGSTDPDAIGVWTIDQGQSAKICAIGVRIRRGATLHGIALNVAADLQGFSLINPCGLSGRPVTSIAKILGPTAPSPGDVKRILIHHFLAAFASQSPSVHNSN
jgi:lipoyl(octanoyl) transferase